MPAGAVIISGVLISASSNAVASCACRGGCRIEQRWTYARPSNLAARHAAAFGAAPRASRRAFALSVNPTAFPTHVPHAPPSIPCYPAVLTQTPLPHRAAPPTRLPHAVSWRSRESIPLIWKRQLGDASAWRSAPPPIASCNDTEASRYINKEGPEDSQL